MGRVDRAIYRTYLAAWSPSLMLLPIFVVVLALSERGMQVGYADVCRIPCVDYLHMTVWMDVCRIPLRRLPAYDGLDGCV